MKNKLINSWEKVFLLPAVLSFAMFAQISVASEVQTVNFPLEKPLLVIKEKKGFLACAYINVETCNKTGEACAIVSGVNNYQDMKEAKIIGVSQAASKLGVEIGDTGASALIKFGQK